MSDVERIVQHEYKPFDQDETLPPPPWKPTDPAIVAWEKAHGHDVRLKCYPEFGCQVIEQALEREIATLRAALDEANTENAQLRDQLRDANTKYGEAFVGALTLQARIAEANTERDRLRDELDRWQDRVSDQATTARAERDHAVAQVQRVQSLLAESETDRMLISNTALRAALAGEGSEQLPTKLGGDDGEH